MSSKYKIINVIVWFIAIIVIMLIALLIISVIILGDQYDIQS